MKTIAVTIYEDNEKLRDVLNMLLGSVEDFHVSGSYSNCRNVTAEILTLRPDVVIMDIDMPGCSGIDGVRMIKELDVTIKVIMHTVFDDDEKLFACLSNGADGYLLKRDTSLQLIPAIRDVIEGGAPMSPGIARKVLTAFHKPKLSEGEYHITEREQQVLNLLARGFSYRMIGIEYSISPETVKRHLKNIYQKLHVQCGPEAVAKAIRAKII
ncbi:response regulator [Chryseolinea lacunae]|uniref:Response regulator transcription factor n=1 Tax=Chryseolinea lacunae TaxID=2801331 RepID=A0ABS1KKC0_9BACT|nr:response regulator transcription factor [Chryseolinea lacunae]MBL0739901.1 response regulator transcription factor [Chryseolinea lacunae]